MASILIPSLPTAYSPRSVSQNVHIHPAGSAKILPAGPAYLSHLRLTLLHNNSFEAHDAYNEKQRQRLQEIQSLLANGEDDLGVGDEPESEDLLALDPKEWKVFIRSFALVLC